VRGILTYWADMTKYIRSLTTLFALVLIISFLNIEIRSMDTVSSIWVYLYLLKPSGIFSIIGILLLLVSLINKPVTRTYYSAIGLLIMWVVVISFYPKYLSSQKSNLINSQSLFILSSIIIAALKILEYIREKGKYPVSPKS